MEKKDKKRDYSALFAILGICYALIQCFWTYFISLKLKNRGILGEITSPQGFLPDFFINFLIFLPMIIIMLGAIVKYRRDFDDNFLYIKTDRYILTLVFTVLYTLMLPLAARVSENPKFGVNAWLYYLICVAFLEEFLFRGLVPTLLNKSSFYRIFKVITPALLYGIYQWALPFAQYGLSKETLLMTLPLALMSFLFHFALIAMKKWTGAMWLPIIVHAIVDLAFYLFI